MELPNNSNKGVEFLSDNIKEIYLAGGCFWGVEAFLGRIYGIEETCVGYANSRVVNPSYEEVCTGETGSVETVYIKYDISKISLDKLIDEFFKIINPTSYNKQGEDQGAQYRTGIYVISAEDKRVAYEKMIEYVPKYDKPILVELKPLYNFYKAEEYHQKYLEKNPSGYCHIDLSLLKK